MYHFHHKKWNKISRDKLPLYHNWFNKYYRAHIERARKSLNIRPGLSVWHGTQISSVFIKTGSDDQLRSFLSHNSSAFFLFVTCKPSSELISCENIKQATWAPLQGNSSTSTFFSMANKLSNFYPSESDT